MDFSDPAQRRVFFDVHSGLPRTSHRNTHGDMRALPFDPGTIDVLWCQGAAYIMGVPNALTTWRPLLKTGGCIALTEPVRLQASVPDIVRRNRAGYPAMTDVESCREIIRRAQLKLSGDVETVREIGLQRAGAANATVDGDQREGERDNQRPAQ